MKWDLPSITAVRHPWGVMGRTLVSSQEAVTEEITVGREHRNGEWVINDKLAAGHGFTLGMIAGG